MLQVYLLLLSSSTVGWWQRRVVVSFFLPHHQKVIQGPTLAPSGWPLALGVFFQEKKSGNRRESALRITGEALKSILKVANVIWACVPFTCGAGLWPACNAVWAGRSHLLKSQVKRESI